MPLAGGGEGGAASYGLPPPGRAMRPGVLHWLPLAGLYLAAHCRLLRAASKGRHWPGAVAATGGRGRGRARLAGAIAYYCVKVVFPPPQCALVATVWSVKYGVIAVAAISVLFGVSLLLWRRGCPVMLIALLWFGLTLLPSLTIALQGTAEHKLAERALYLPSIGLSLIVGALFARALTRPATQWIAAVVGAGGGGGGGVRDGRAHPRLARSALAVDQHRRHGDRYGAAQVFARHGVPSRGRAREGAGSLPRESSNCIRVSADREGCFLAHNSIGAVLMGNGQVGRSRGGLPRVVAGEPCVPDGVLQPRQDLRDACRADPPTEPTAGIRAHGAGARLLHDRDSAESELHQGRATRSPASNATWPCCTAASSAIRRVPSSFGRAPRAGAAALAQLDPNSPQGQSAVKLIQIIDAERQQAPRPVDDPPVSETLGTLGAMLSRQRGHAHPLRVRAWHPPAGVH